MARMLLVLVCTRYIKEPCRFLIKAWMSSVCASVNIIDALQYHAAAWTRYCIGYVGSVWFFSIYMPSIYCTCKITGNKPGTRRPHSSQIYGSTYYYLQPAAYACSLCQCHLLVEVYTSQMVNMPNNRYSITLQGVTFNSLYNNSKRNNEDFTAEANTHFLVLWRRSHDFSVNNHWCFMFTKSYSTIFVSIANIHYFEVCILEFLDEGRKVSTCFIVHSSLSLKMECFYFRIWFSLDILSCISQCF